MKEKVDFDIAVIQLPKALNRCARAYRQIAARFALAAFSAAEGESSSQFEQIGELLAKSEACSVFCCRLKRAFADMQEQEAKLIRRIFVQGMSVADLAAECGVSVSTVYRKMCSARKHFNKALADNGLTKQWVLEEFSDIPLMRKIVKGKYGKTAMFVVDESAIHLKALV